MDKKAQNQYMSWILIFGMVVALSFILYNWSIDQAKERTKEIKSRADPIACQETGISIEGSCQTFRSLKLNISNVNSLKISGFIIRTVGLYPEDENYLNTQTIFYELIPGDTEKITVIKKNTLSQIEVIPIITKDKDNVYCEEQSITKEINQLKQC